MIEDSAISIELTENQVIAAKFIVATWDDPGTAPELMDDDGVEHLAFPTGLSGVARALEAVQAAVTHGGGLAASARDLADRLEQVLRSS